MSAWPPLIDARGKGTITGGSVAVVALGSTSCSIVCSSSPSVERLEFDLSLLAVVFEVSARCKGFAKREDTLPLFRTDDCSNVSTFFLEIRLAGTLTAFGLWSIPTLKSHKSSRQSSPTLPNR